MTVTETTSPGLGFTIAALCALVFAFVYHREMLDRAEARFDELRDKLSRVNATNLGPMRDGYVPPPPPPRPRANPLADDQGPDKPDGPRRGARPPEPWPRPDPFGGRALVTCAYCSAGVAPNRRCGNCGALAPAFPPGSTDNAKDAGRGLGNIRPSEPVAYLDR